VTTHEILEVIGEKNIERIEKISGFKYNGGRDLTGFVDGTRNAPFLVTILDTAIIHSGDEDSDENIGGSYLLASRFAHDLKKFESLSTDEKSKLVGRDFGKIESNSNPKLPDALDHLKPGSGFVYPSLPSSNYHINRGYGVMFRQAWPYRTETEAGLYFMAFSRSLREIDKALNRMLGINTDDETQVDNLLAITKAVTCNYYYCPSVTQLQMLAKK